MSEKFRIGSIARCIGMKGEVIINPDTFDLNRFLELDSVFIGRTEDTGKTFLIESIRFHKERPVIKFSSIETRDAAEQIVGRILYVDESERIKLPDGYFFIHDIVGMDVYAIDGEYIGTVKDVLQLPAQNVYIVDYNNKEVMIPAVDEFIESIDEHKRVIRIKPIEGLLE